MPRMSYEPATRDAILKAAKDARANDKTWTEAHAAATEAGYKGGVQGIIKLMRANEEGGGGGKAKRKPGRPKGSRNKMMNQKSTAMATPRMAKSGGGSNDILSMVENIVKSRVNAALDYAISALQSARG